MSIYVAGTLWVAGVAGVAAAMTILVHRLRRGSGDANDAVSAIFTIVAGLQAVLMAFVLISLFDTVSEVEDGAFAEANALVGVYWASDSLPPETRDQIHALSKSYAEAVAEQEWPRMQDGEQVGGPGWELLEQLRMAIDSAPAAGDWQQERKSEAAAQLWAVYEARQARLTAADGAGVSTVVWLALIVGSVLTISLPYLFDVSKLVTHMIIVGALAATIALLMFSISQLQNPFGGGALVEPDAFISAIDRMPGRSG